MNPISPHKTNHHNKRHIVFLLILIALNISLAGCATWQMPPEFDISTLRSRAVSDEINGVRLSAAVLSHEDSLGMFGVNLIQKGIQPIWIEVNNTTEQTLWLLQSGTDPDTFSPLEVAWSFHAAFSGENNARLDAYFDALAFQSPINPKTTRTGIIFTNPHEVVRLLNVDILGQAELFPFTLFPVIPDDSQGKQARNILNRFTDEKYEDYQDADSLRALLEKLACCATSADGKESGDPVNVVLIGDLEDLSAATVRRGYRMNIQEFDDKQYLYGRPPDIVVRKSGQGGTPANWLRAWLAPFRYQGKAVFLAQAGRPVGGRFIQTKGSKPILHPNVDEVRNYFVGDMMSSGSLAKIAFLPGVGKVDQEAPKKTLEGASYFTDGIRTVMFIVTRPRAISEVEILDWDPLNKLYK